MRTSKQNKIKLWKNAKIIRNGRTQRVSPRKKNFVYTSVKTLLF